MGFSVYYRSTRPVTPAQADALARAAEALCHGRTWLGCEPVGFFPDQGDGHLSGASKPNFLPHPADAASAARSGLPDGTTRDLLEVLCQLSRAHGIDWEVSHDYSDGPVGYIRGGVCDDDVAAQVEAFADLGDILGDLEAGLETPADEDGEDGPSTLPIRPS